MNGMVYHDILPGPELVSKQFFSVALADTLLKRAESGFVLVKFEVHLFGSGCVEGFSKATNYSFQNLYLTDPYLISPKNRDSKTKSCSNTMPLVANA